MRKRLRKGGNAIMTMYVDFHEKIPCHEEIRKRYDQLEASLREEQTPEALHLAEVMAMYRKTGRLALTWGWFLEKVLTDPDKRPGEDFTEEADRIVAKLVNEIYSEEKERLFDELERGCRQMIEMLNGERIVFTWYSLEKLHSDHPIFEEMLLNFREFGKMSGLAEKRKNWPFLKKWMECFAAEAECAEGINRIWYTIMDQTVPWVLINKSSNPYDPEDILEQLAEVQEFAVRNPGVGSLYAKCALTVYCKLGDYQGRDFAKEAPIRERILEKLRMLAQNGENLFTCFFQSGYVPIGIVERLSELLELYEKGERKQKVELRDIDEWVKHGKQAVIRPRPKKGMFYPRVEFSGFSDELFQVLLWIAKHLEVTDDLGESDALIQYYLLSSASEEELCFLNRRGFFPKRILDEVIKLARRGETYGKIPLLIQWLYE